MLEKSRALVDVKRRFDTEVREIQKRYYDFLIDPLHEIARPIFDTGEVGSITLFQTNDCYNDEDYYYGVLYTRYYDDSGEELEYADEQDEWDESLRCFVEANQYVYQAIIGNAAVKLYQSSYEISAEGKEN